jgi:sulfite reductase (NADPH) flavoprotein alpha-component
MEKMESVSEADLTILYGSQSGNAEFLAYNASEAAKKAGLTIELLPLDDALQSGNLTWKRLLVVTATHDNGHMPDNAAAFWSWLQSCDAGQYEGLPFAVLAIGDSMYVDFCKAGQDFDQAFLGLGATPMLERIDCDVDFDMTAAPWIKKLIASVPSISPWVPSSSVHIDAEAAQQFSTVPEEWHTATVSGQRQLTSPHSEKRVFHFDLELPESFTYLPGDSLDIKPQNHEHLVEEWLQAFPPAEFVQLGDEKVPFRDALTYRLELRLPHIGLVNALLTRIASSEAADRIRNLLESGDRHDLNEWLDGRDVLDVVAELGFTGQDVQPIIDVMRPLQHRSYSIASSPQVSESRLGLTVSSIAYESADRSHFGAGSSYLDSAVGHNVSVRRVAAHDFRLPKDDSPLIMVGPRVGVAQFIGFLQDIEARKTGNDTWLFFGDQHRAADWLYQDEMRGWLDSGVLTNLSLAFSRDQSEKHYVQDEIRARASDIRAWVNRGAHIYICGDKNRMAHDVEQALIEVLGEGSNDPQLGITTLESLREAGRYAKDVY